MIFDTTVFNPHTIFSPEDDYCDFCDFCDRIDSLRDRSQKALKENYWVIPLVFQYLNFPFMRSYLPRWDYHILTCQNGVIIEKVLKQSFIPSDPNNYPVIDTTGEWIFYTAYAVYDGNGFVVWTTEPKGFHEAIIKKV